METEATGKDADDEASYQPYRRSNFTSAGAYGDMRISEITTCVGSDHGHLKGFGLRLSSPDGERVLDLPWMGKEDAGTCETVVPPGPIDMIRTGAADSRSKFVKSISWHSGDWSANYNVDDGDRSLETWTFTEEDPIVAMYGKLNSDNMIKQLGWIMLDT